MLRALIIGHSHVAALQRAAAKPRDGMGARFEFLALRDPSFRPHASLGASDKEAKARASTPQGIDRAAVADRIAQLTPDVAVLYINGNEHGTLGLFATGASVQDRELRLERVLRHGLGEWFDLLLPQLPARVLFVAPPPPVALDRLEGHFPPERIAAFSGLELEAPANRLRLWHHHCAVLRSICDARGIAFVDPPAAALDGEGFLATDYAGADPMHANPAYGKLLLDKLDEHISAPPPQAAPSGVAAAVPHPYSALPDTSFWKQSIAMREASETDPMLRPPFLIGPKDRVATAGSCFAQHISRHLRRAGFRHMVAETGPADPVQAERRGFHDFSARYGNIYTARQLLQLFDRAFGYFRPLERVWAVPDRGFCDPFRPRVEPSCFASAAQVEDDTRRHLAAVRRMFRQLDVFVFTLGLTEAWTSRLDGAVYPVAPGVVGGRFDTAQHAFVNFSVQEVVADLEDFLRKLEFVNARARVVLTVSPVPLVATASDRHVLSATIYSKSVLRVAAEEVSRRRTERVCYFPSYEIIAGPQAQGAYFEQDRRSVTAAGVAHVMRVFMARMTRAEEAGQAATGAATESERSIESLMEVACDEEALTR